MTDMSTLPKDDPRDDAFAAYKDSDDYANTRRWALYEEHVDGSLWAAFIAGYAARHSPTPEPIQMLLYCPRCGEQHVDEPHADWTNPPHRSHLCHGCGCIWRPADVPTNGVRVISTAGMADNWLASTSEAIGNARAATPKPSPEELSYRWAHEDAVEMGYPSLTEALEHLSELRASRTPEPDLAKLLLGDIESGRVAMGSSCDCDFCRSALTASPAEPEEATEATHWVFHGKVAHVYTMRTACGKDYRYPVKGTDYAAHRVTCPDCRAALRSAASGGDTV